MHRILTDDRDSSNQRQESKVIWLINPIPTLPMQLVRLACSFPMRSSADFGCGWPWSLDLPFSIAITLESIPNHRHLHSH